MKKKYSLIVALSLMVTAQAQTTYGIRAGVNLSNASSNSSESKTSYRFGETAGVYANVKVNDNFSVQPELLYSSEGYKRSRTYNDDFKIGYHIHSSYLNLPVFAKYKLNNGLVFEIGPQVSYLLGGHIRYTYNFVNENNIAVEETEKVKLKSDVTRSFEFAGVVGIGYELKGGYSLNARYTQGFTNFIHTDSESLKNQYFSFTVGIPIIKH